MVCKKQVRHALSVPDREERHLLSKDLESGEPVSRASAQEKKMPQSGVGSMQGKNTGNMPSAVFASSMNKSLDPTPI